MATVIIKLVVITTLLAIASDGRYSVQMDVGSCEGGIMRTHHALRTRDRIRAGGVIWLIDLQQMAAGDSFASSGPGTICAVAEKQIPILIILRTREVAREK